MIGRGPHPGAAAGLMVALAACGKLDLRLVESEPEQVRPIPCDAQASCSGYPDTPQCDLDGGFCVQCLSGDDCQGQSARLCIRGSCVACQTSNDCPADFLCNQAIPRCATSCATDVTACTKLTMQRACGGPSYPYCVDCTQEGANAPECENNFTGTYCFGIPSGACGCRQDTDCPSPDKPHCQAPNPWNLQFCGN